MSDEDRKKEKKKKSPGFFFCELFDIFHSFQAPDNYSNERICEKENSLPG